MKDFKLKVSHSGFTTPDINTIEHDENYPSMCGYINTEYYMMRLNNYYFRNRFGRLIIAHNNKSFVDSLVYGCNYNIGINPFKIVVAVIEP